jgi:hypothetical protein
MFKQLEEQTGEAWKAAKCNALSIIGSIEENAIFT